MFNYLLITIQYFSVLCHAQTLNEVRNFHPPFAVFKNLFIVLENDISKLSISLFNFIVVFRYPFSEFFELQAFLMMHFMYSVMIMNANVVETPA